MSVKTVDEGLNGGLVNVTDVRGCLPRLLTQDDSMGVDETEGINDDLALDRLDRIYDHGNRARIQGFERLTRKFDRYIRGKMRR